MELKREGAGGINHQLELDRINKEENDRIQAIKEARKKVLRLMKMQKRLLLHRLTNNV